MMTQTATATRPLARRAPYAAPLVQVPRRLTAQEVNFRTLSEVATHVNTERTAAVHSVARYRVRAYDASTDTAIIESIGGEVHTVNLRTRTCSCSCAKRNREMRQLVKAAFPDEPDLLVGLDERHVQITEMLLSNRTDR